MPIDIASACVTKIYDINHKPVSVSRSNILGKYLIMYLFLMNLKYIELFEVIGRVGVDDDLLADGFFKCSDQGIFFVVQQLSDLRIDSQCQPDTIHILGLPQNLTVNRVTDRSLGNDIAFTFTVITGFA